MKKSKRTFNQARIFTDTLPKFQEANRFERASNNLVTPSET